MKKCSALRSELAQRIIFAKPLKLFQLFHNRESNINLCLKVRILTSNITHTVPKNCDPISFINIKIINGEHV
jgi:hypothetical protein